MCVNITMLAQEDVDKFGAFLEELNEGKPFTESQSVLGVVLAFTALLLQAGEEVHLPGNPEIMAELIRRAQVNQERGQQQQQPLLNKDWEKIELEARLAELNSQVPDGVQPPSPYQPPTGQRPTINPPKAPEEDDGEGRGMYL